VLCCTQDETVELEANNILHLTANKYPFKVILKTDFVSTEGTAAPEGKGMKRTSSGEPKKAKPKIDYNHWSHGLLGKYSCHYAYLIKFIFYILLFQANVSWLLYPSEAECFIGIDTVR
jgi:hypothetical protein